MESFKNTTGSLGQPMENLPMASLRTSPSENLRKAEENLRKSKENLRKPVENL